VVAMIFLCRRFERKLYLNVVSGQYRGAVWASLSSLKALL
jgi:hypothetical protein